MSNKTRTEHLNWCKKRAIEYVEKNDLSGAFSSFCSDLGKHPETQGHMVIPLGMNLLMNGKLSTKQEMRKFIEDTN